MAEMGRFLIIAGVVLVIVGVLVWLTPKIPWWGRLPGDLVWRRENFTVYFPLGTCILLSIILTVVLYLFRR